MSRITVSNCLSSKSSQRRRPRIDATLFVAGGSSLLAFGLPAPQHDAIAGLPSLCPWYALTGIPCPGCGLTRSVVCCAHGLWHQSLLYHPLGPLALGGMIGMTIWRLSTLYPPTRVVAMRMVVAPRFRMPLAAAVATLLLVTWCVRLAGFWPLPP